MNGSGEEAFREFMLQLMSDFIAFIPKLILGIIVVIIAFLVLKLAGGAIKKLLSLANLDGLMEKHLGMRLPISLNSVILWIFYAGVLLASLYALIHIFLGPEYLGLANSALIYGARVISVIVIALILFTAFSAIIEKIRVESRLKGYLLFVVMLLITTMLIDITALSEPVKQALYTGLAVGIGASLAIFSIWFFFNEYLEKLLEKPRRRRQSESDGRRTPDNPRS
ncbi:MAG: hypothetical protein QXI18_02385 [Nitrososphaerota archaeon]